MMHFCVPSWRGFSRKQTLQVADERVIRMILRRWVAACPWYLFAGVLWFVRFATLDNLPWWREPVWLQWFDQSRYLTSATAFANGDLLPSSHWYPLGYSLLAAPFTCILPSNPFFLLDLLLFLLACKAFQNVVARLRIGLWLATFCFLATTLIDTKLAGTWAHPWTTTLSATLIWWLIDRTLLVGDSVGDGKVTRSGLLPAIGALAMGLPLVRPVDAIVGVTCLAIVGLTLWRRGQFSIGALLSIGAGSAVVASVYGALHFAIYGLHLTPYMLESAATGFIWSDLGWKAYILLVHARPWYPDSQAILERLPWIVPGCAGLIVAAVVEQRRGRGVILLLFALIVPVSAVMLTYADLQPPGLWYFGNIHYFKWVMPAFGAGIVLCWRQIRQRSDQRILTIVLVAFLLPLAVRIMPQPVSEDAPARMLLFRGDTHRAWEEAYFSHVEITDGSGRLMNIRDFHQVPDASGERALAISRLFGRHPRRFDPSEKLVGPKQPPFARFGERTSLIGF